MFIYLSKKIAIPSGVKLKSIAWNPEQGWIACGGDGGLLKVLKLDSSSGGKDSKAKGVAAPSNLSMNQTLEGHDGGVMCVTWNANYRKLTTSDENGLIIVWMLHKGMWFEEMINNRNKSVVRDMKWTADGQKICIVYQDGAVIVGSVDGNRLWGKELDVTLEFVEWSPDARNILFVTQNGEVHIYDNLGNRIKSMPMYALEDLPSGEELVVGIHWYDGAEGHADPNAPTLALAFENGRVQITRGDEDDNPVLIDTRMALSQCRWNTDGSVLALAGSQTTTMPSGEQRDVSMVQFYTPYGNHLRTLKVPGSGISALSWECGGLRIALAVDSHIYFANIRPDYKWGFFANTLVYAFNKPERQEMCTIFWDMHTDERYTKYIKKLWCIRAAGDNCVVLKGPHSALESEVGGPGDEGEKGAATGTGGGGEGKRGEGKDSDGGKDDANGGRPQYAVELCNAIGAPLDCKYIDITPHHVCMTATHVVCAEDRYVYVWQYRTQASTKATAVSGNAATGALRRQAGRERMFDVDDQSSQPAQNVETWQLEQQQGRERKATNDPVCALAASDRYLIVARDSGTIHRYTLPHISLETRYMVRCRPQKLALNCDSTRLSIIDIHGVLTFFDMDARPEGLGGPQGEHLNFERKDTWDMIWAEDNPELFAMMEKTRMYIFRGLEPEEPCLSSGYLSTFRDLTIKAVMLDEIVQNPEAPEKEMVLDFETKSLRDARDLLRNAGAGIRDATQYIEDHPHPRLWRLLAEAALEELNFGVAEKAFVRCGDYQGIQQVKRLQSLNDRIKQRAEVAAYFQRFDEAEAIYREIDRKDLAIDLRMRLGDWFRVVQLVQSGGGDDRLLNIAWNKIGDYYADRQKWGKALQYYTQAKNQEALADCCYRLEDYDGMEKLLHSLPTGAPLLHDLGAKFESVGIHENAVASFLKAGDVKAAIDSCVVLNQWNRAVELAEEHRFPQIEGLLSKYANHLLDKGDILQAIELYRKANKATDAAKLLARVATDVGKNKVNPLRAKKLHVLGALEVERFRKRMLDQTTQGGDIAQTTAQTLDNLMQHDAATGENRHLDNPWRGAEAYHYLLLAHQQLYGGSMDEAMKTSIRLAEYEDILEPKAIYSLVALASFHNRYFRVCSRAFIKLEAHCADDSEDRRVIEQLALDIFTENPPNDPTHLDMAFMSCLDQGTPFTACVKTGQLIEPSSRTYTCHVCRHRAIETELRGVNNCPLCHSVLLAGAQRGDAERGRQRGNNHTTGGAGKYKL